MTAPVPPPRKLKVATVSLAGCFGCHMSFLDIDERLFELIEHIEFDRSPFTDIKGSVAKFGIWAKTEKLIAIISRTYSARN